MRLHQVNLICGDPDSARAFYEQLGFTFRRISPAGFNPSYVSTAPPGTALALHAKDFASWWLGRSTAATAGSEVLDIELAHVTEVDDVVTRLRELGHRVAKEPQDMEWGDRYAVVLDPDGRQIGVKASAA